MKYAVVTGGTSGMGMGVAKMLIQKGYYVFTTYVGPEFTDQIENFEAHLVDQTKREEVYAFIKYVKSRTDHLDCIVVFYRDKRCGLGQADGGGRQFPLYYGARVLPDNPSGKSDSLYRFPDGGSSARNGACIRCDEVSSVCVVQEPCQGV